jgi:hypothetical protein
MLARRLALAIAVLAGLIGSQAPEFAQQYRQRLVGALEEPNRIVSEFDAEVQRQNLSRAAALKRLGTTRTRWRANAARTWARRSSAPRVSTSRFRR